MKSWILIPDILCFATLVVFCFLEWLKGSRSLHKDPDASISSTGTEMRGRIQILLLLANLSRCLCLVVETVFYEDYLCPSERTCAMVRCIPDLVFLTAYSLIILFWAQLSHTATGLPFPWLGPFFVVLNLALYLVFAVLVVLTFTVLSHMQVLRALFGVLGIAYLISMLFLLKYGVRMMRFSRHVLPSVVLRRLVGLCVICSTTFLLHLLYYGGLATSFLPWVDGYPPHVNPYVFDALFYPLLELLPSFLILMIIYKRKGQPSPSWHVDSINNPYSQIREVTVQGFQRFSALDAGQVVREGSNGAGLMGLYSPIESTPILPTTNGGYHTTMSY